MATHQEARCTRIPLAFGLGLMLMAAALPTAADGEGPGGQLIGFAGPATTGSFDVVTYNSRCAAQHPGRAAHMCTSKELFSFPPALESDFPEEGVWVHPVVVGVERWTDTEGGQHIAYRDYSGIHGGAGIAGLVVFDRFDRLTCNGWSSESAQFFGLSYGGRFALASCDEVKLIACCGLPCDEGCPPPREDPQEGFCCRLPSSTGAPQCTQVPTCSECIDQGGVCSTGTCNPRAGVCQGRR